MSAACERILQRLSDVGFKTRLGSLSPFDQELPLVNGAAWEPGTAQMALVAEMENGSDLEVWRQLIFAVAGLRHFLGAEGPAAFGTPLLLVVVDEAGERTMRTLVEDLNQQYAVFNRVDLNLVRREQLGDDALDDALAPLLPRCRRALGKEISKADVRRFWGDLRGRVEAAAEDLDEIFAGHRKVAGERAAENLVGDLDEAPDLPSIAAVSLLKMTHFRSFAEAEAPFSPVTVLHGSNGSGKSALLEALELGWAGTSQRKPWDVDASEYERHLPRGGEGQFEVDIGAEPVVEVEKEARAELARCILPQDRIAALVNNPPDERYAELMAITGLELPEVGERTENLIREAKKAADEALQEAGLPPMRSIANDGRKHLLKGLQGGFAARVPVAADLVGIEQVLAKASAGAYPPRTWTPDPAAAEACETVDARLASVPLERDPELVSDLDTAAGALRKAAVPRREAALSLRLLVEAIREAAADYEDEPEGAEQLVPEVPRRVAVRWLSHGRSLADFAESFREDAEEIEDEGWSRRLRDYADSLGIVADSVPHRELEKFAGSVPKGEPRPRASIGSEVFVAAGFSGLVGDPLALLPALEELLEVLQRQADDLEALAAELDQHPARSFHEHSERVLAALAGYELARTIRRKGPIEEASAETISELLRERLSPLVRELVMALVRFEWYFKPVRLVDHEGKIKIAGGATESDSLDARMMLNSAERSVVGLAWFMALNLLQPEDRRRVVVIDDAAAAFDVVNQAAFASTLGAFLRLTRPQQVILATHDEAVADSLAKELSPVGDWPLATTRLRCRRDELDASVVVPEARYEEPRDLQADLERLGLADAPAVPA